jgi:hypothetical protein
MMPLISLVAGTNQFQLALFNDDNATPGTAVATVTVKDAPPAGSNEDGLPAPTCCQLVTGKLAIPGIALTANTQYWLVAMSDDVNAPSFEGIWAFSNFAFVASAGVADGEPSWSVSQTAGALAGAVQGTVP